METQDRRLLQSARESAPEARGSVFDPHPLVLGLEPGDGLHRRLDLLTVLQVTKRWRDAILTRSNGLSEGARELLSGHDREGAPLEGPHLAFLPLALLGHEHADGRLLGMALALPEYVSADARREALRAIAAVRHLALGRLGRWSIASDTGGSETGSLRAEAWTAHPGGATHWSSVTPVVFDRHPKSDRRDRYQAEVASTIAKACARIALPEPREAIVTTVSAHSGVPPAFRFPRLSRKDGSARSHAHATLVFDRPVRGPIAIGAGRYRGYGFFPPLDGVAPASQGNVSPERSR
jgi:CRISPR-associated protein Csb2